MNKQYTYTDKTTHSDMDIRWLLSLDGQDVQIFCNGESRTYTIPEPVIDFKVEAEYVYIYVEGKFYQFKFEVDKFLVVDIFHDNDDDVESFGCYVFGEDCNLI